MPIKRRMEIYVEVYSYNGLGHNNKIICCMSWIEPFKCSKQAKKNNTCQTQAHTHTHKKKQTGMNLIDRWSGGEKLDAQKCL